MAEHSVLSALPAGVLDAAAAIGLDRKALVAASGIDPVALADPDARVPLEQHLRLWAALSEHALGLEIGARLGLAGMGVIGYAMQHGATVGDALDWLWRFRAVIHPDVVPLIERRSGAAGDELVFSRAVPLPFVRLREPVYAQAAATVAVMQALTGLALRPLWISLPLPRPPDADRVEAFLGCAVRWGTPAFEAAFAGGLLTRPLPRADDRLFGYLAHRVRQLHEALTDEASFTAKSRSAIGDLLVRGEPRLGAVARTLGVSERTLHRRLQDEGASFAALLDQIRRERALLLLEDPRLTGSQIAFLLGYADPAPFFRAFKRWTGQTCQAWRRAHAPA